MRPVEPPDDIEGARVTLKGNGDDVGDLRIVTADGNTVTSAWQIEPEERAALLNGAPLLIDTMTFGYAFQPMHPYVPAADDVEASL